MIITCFLVGLGVSVIAKNIGMSQEFSILCASVLGCVVACFWRK